MGAAKLLTLKDLHDPERFETLEDVPIFDEHDEHDSDGKLIRHFGKAELQEIADNNNRRAASGDFGFLNIGHTQPKAGEKEQPETVGFTSFCKVGEHNGKGCILSAWHLLKDRASAATEFPRRSVELWMKDKFIDAVALLKRAPKRDLGILSYSRSSYDENGQKLRYIMASENHEDIVLAVREALAADPVYQYARQHYEKANPPEQKAKPLTEPPAAGDPETLRMVRDSEAIKYAKLEERVTLAEAKAEATQLLYQRERREKDLIQLEAEGYDLDRAAELADVEKLSDADYAKHLGRIRKHYQRYPGGATFLHIAHDPVEGGGREGECTAYERDAALELVHAGKAKDFDEGFRMVRKKA